MRSWNTMSFGVLARSVVINHQMVNSIIKEKVEKFFCMRRAAYTLDAGNVLWLVRIEED